MKLLVLHKSHLRVELILSNLCIAGGPRDDSAVELGKSIWVPRSAITIKEELNGSYFSDCRDSEKVRRPGVNPHSKFGDTDNSLISYCLIQKNKLKIFVRPLKCLLRLSVWNRTKKFLRLQNELYILKALYQHTNSCVQEDLKIEIDRIIGLFVSSVCASDGTFSLWST